MRCRELSESFRTQILGVKSGARTRIAHILNEGVFCGCSVNMPKTGAKSLLKMTMKIGALSTIFLLTSFLVGDIIYIIITSEKFACWGRSETNIPRVRMFSG